MSCKAKKNPGHTDVTNECVNYTYSYHMHTAMKFVHTLNNIASYISCHCLVIKDSTRSTVTVELLSNPIMDEINPTVCASHCKLYGVKSVRPIRSSIANRHAAAGVAKNPDIS